MARLPDKITYAVLGACGGLVSFIPTANCAGGNCAGCYGCLGAGALIVLLGLLNKRRKSEQGEKDHGMAEVGN